MVFLYTGQGSQYVGMGRQLYETQPTFRRAMQRCAELLGKELEEPLLKVLYGEDGEAGAARLQETGYAQAALFAVEYSLTEVWRSWGIEPVAVMGHSVGEYVAACVAGVFSLEDGLRLISARGRLMQALGGVGEMAAVFASEERVAEVLGGYEGRVSIAAVNAPGETVISGEREGVREVLGKLKGRGMKVRQLAVAHGFHSPLMEPMQEAFGRVAEGVEYAAPQIGLVSGLSGRMWEQEVMEGGYWRRQAREGVRFMEGMETLEGKGYRVYVEVGPQPVLLGIGRRCVRGGERVWLPSLRPGQEEWRQMLESLGELYVQGVRVDWEGFDRDYVRQRMGLPTYAFQRRRYWIEGSEKKKGEGRRKKEWEKGVHPLLGRRVSSALPEKQFEGEISLEEQGYLGDHRIHGQAVMPGACTVEMALAAGREVWGVGGVVVEEVVLEEPLVVREGEGQKVQMIVRGGGSGEGSFELYRQAGGGEEGEERWRRQAHGKVRQGERRVVGGSRGVGRVPGAVRGGSWGRGILRANEGAGVGIWAAVSRVGRDLARGGRGGGRDPGGGGDGGGRGRIWDTPGGAGCGISVDGSGAGRRGGRGDVYTGGDGAGGVAGSWRKRRTVLEPCEGTGRGRESRGGRRYPAVGRRRSGGGSERAEAAAGGAAGMGACEPCGERGMVVRSAVASEGEGRSGRGRGERG